MRETVRFPQVVKKQSSPRGCNVSQKNQPLAWHWLLQTVGLITNCLTISGTTKFWNQIVTSLRELSLGHVLKIWRLRHIQSAETAGKFYCLSKNQSRQCWESKTGQGHAEYRCHGRYVLHCLFGAWLALRFRLQSYRWRKHLRSQERNIKYKMAPYIHIQKWYVYK